ncbi:hypothetical protein MNBD_ALPHA12-2035 [hydrothermal vent metagenome]|uniref:Uncharacterized protein n=1 Tax=hydrothermal vent metagenome TaxID=652676 RepID=A0A3B0T6I6_9ZZZZ
MFSLKAVLPALFALTIIGAPSLALAQFQKSEARVFVDWPELQVDPMPGGQSEAMVYAVIDGEVALYTIAVQNRNNIAVLGAFQCNKEFTILKSSTNGFYDIRCVDQDVFKQPKAYILRYGNNGLYNQKF